VIVDADPKPWIVPETVEEAGLTRPAGLLPHGVEGADAVLAAAR
jgi:hypothetical protein